MNLLLENLEKMNKNEELMACVKKFIEHKIS